MPTFTVLVDTLDRRSSFQIEWEADDVEAIIAEVKETGCVDVLMDDGGVEIFPLASIRKLTIEPLAEAPDAVS
jgi:hypothetical protein